MCRFTPCMFYAIYDFSTNETKFYVWTNYLQSSADSSRFVFCFSKQSAKQNQSDMTCGQFPKSERFCFFSTLILLFLLIYKDLVFLLLNMSRVSFLQSLETLILIKTGKIRLSILKTKSNKRLCFFL